MNKNQHTFEAKNIGTGYDKKIIIDEERVLRIVSPATR